MSASDTVFEVREGSRLLAEFTTRSRAMKFRAEMEAKGRPVRVVGVYREHSLPVRTPREEPLPMRPTDPQLPRGLKTPADWRGGTGSKDEVLSAFKNKARVRAVDGTLYDLTVAETRKGYRYTMCPVSDPLSCVAGDCFDDQLQYDGRYVGFMERGLLVNFVEVIKLGRPGRIKSKPRLEPVQGTILQETVRRILREESVKGTVRLSGYAHGTEAVYEVRVRPEGRVFYTVSGLSDPVLRHAVRVYGPMGLRLGDYTVSADRSDTEDAVRTVAVFVRRALGSIQEPEPKRGRSR